MKTKLRNEKRNKKQEYQGLKLKVFFLHLSNNYIITLNINDLLLLFYWHIKFNNYIHSEDNCFA